MYLGQPPQSQDFSHIPFLFLIHRTSTLDGVLSVTILSLCVASFCDEKGIFITYSYLSREVVTSGRRNPEISNEPPFAGLDTLLKSRV